jgi:dephospho-CoA kinase
VLKIGLTGGIGSGKTTVSELFKQCGVPVIDADEIAHQLVTIGKPALQQIKQVFGTAFIDSEGVLNRQKMRDHVFSNPQAKQKLEAIMHPLIYDAIQSELSRLSGPYCIVCVPLLLETNMVTLVNRVLVIDCPVAQQIERVKKRTKITTERIQTIIDSQMVREMKLLKADDVIDNSATEANLVQQVNALHQLYISLSTL